MVSREYGAAGRGHRSQLGWATATLCLVGTGVHAPATIQAQQRETVRDAPVRITSELVMQVPEVPRWEEAFGIVGRRVSVGDAELYVEQEGTGIPMVLLHGGPGETHHAFHPWFSRASAHARLIYYDQRGCGLSDWEPGDSGYSIDQAVRDLEALRNALAIDEWVLAGFSYGGFLAQYYATIYPERVAGLVLVGASPGMWTDFGADRQSDYIAQEERARVDEVHAQLRRLRTDEGWSYHDYMQRLLYNSFINGNWRRQHFYRPSDQEVARIASYGWVHDERFRGPMNSGQSQVDLTGAFDRNPIPTLILEGKWDLTWGDAKATLLSRNHPNARMIVIEGAGHSIYDENPEAFFAVLEDFLLDLAPVTPARRGQFTESLATWRARQAASFDHRVLPWDWGVAASRELAAAYRADALDDIRRLLTLARIGFALYDVERYQDAIVVFRVLADAAAERGDQEDVSFGLLWQGHMLDLLGRRDEAIDRYQRVLARQHDGQWVHDQYGLRYDLMAEATTRLAVPFRRIENREP